MTFYTEPQRALQHRFGGQTVADALEATIVVNELEDHHIEFIRSRDFFFLATVDASGSPTVSHKGGPVGVVTVVDPTTLAFPHYDGNSMYLSMGNVDDTGRIGMLFIDFETPNRVRVQATATVSDDDPLLDRYPGATLIVRAKIDHAFVNCARYIHRHVRVDSSRYVPDADGNAPVASWKRIDLLQPLLPDEVRSEVEAAGGTITADDYAQRLADGTS